MITVWLFLLIFLQKNIADELLCEFSYDKKFGYTCRVSHFATNRTKVNIKSINGTHLSRLHDFDVFRATFYNLHLAYLPANLTLHFSNLRTLQAKNCGLKALTQSSDFFRLKRLYLGYNAIEIIPKVYFWYFCRLEILSLFSNKISSINSLAFRDLIQLKRLSLNKNRLTSINPRLFSNCVNLEMVDLDNNQLTVLEGDLFRNLTRLRQIFLQNNHLASIESNFLMLDHATVSLLLLRNNSCIDFSYPKDGNYVNLQKIFIENCIAPCLIVTQQKPKYDKHRRTKKPKFKKSNIIYSENCTWHIYKNYSHLYKKDFH
jgi:Leucine-rich repeat (LRR) protein